MKEYELFIKENFDCFKCKSKYDPLKCIPIYDDKDGICGYLRPITQDYRVTLPDCANLLAQWRNENPSMSSGPFTATPEGTEIWLDKLVIERDDRILFLVISVDGTKLGHIGYSSFHFAEKSCEVDAVLRGVKSSYPGMMTFALRGLIGWGLKDLGLQKITLRVFSDNDRAIDFYHNNGFFIDEETIPNHEDTEKQYTLMMLDLDQWKEN